MTPSNLQHILTRFFIKQSRYCSGVNIKGVYYIQKIIIRV